MNEIINTNNNCQTNYGYSFIFNLGFRIPCEDNLKCQISSNAKEGDIPVHVHVAVQYTVTGKKKKIFASLGENIRDVAKIFSHGIEQMLLLNMAADWHKIKEL